MALFMMFLDTEDIFGWWAIIKDYIVKMKVLDIDDKQWEFLPFYIRSRWKLRYAVTVSE